MSEMTFNLSFINNLFENNQAEYSTIVLINKVPNLIYIILK
jgi:hypothetical protein